MFSKFTNFTLETGLCTQKERERERERESEKETSIAIIEKKDVLTTNAKAKFLLQSHLTKQCDKLL